jgi:hypothetical protein
MGRFNCSLDRKLALPHRQPSIFCAPNNNDNLAALGVLWVRPRRPKPFAPPPVNEVSNMLALCVTCAQVVNVPRRK